MTYFHIMLFIVELKIDKYWELDNVNDLQFHLVIWF